MEPELTRSERRKVRELAELAWERQLREEILKIGDAIQEMRNGAATPHDVDELIHRFHQGPSRKLFQLYSDNNPWWAVCRAHHDGILTDDDIAKASDKIIAGIRQFAKAIEM